MTEASVSFAGNLTEAPQVRYTEDGIARRCAVPDSLKGRTGTILA